jgi:uncharacterized protein
MISSKLVRRIITEYTLPTDGLHGLSHWARVLENGQRLAEKTGAKIEIVKLFAVFHDAKRINEGMDSGHGRRGAEYATSLRGILFDLSNEAFDLLYTACAYHTDGLTDGDITVQTCWDADRLDLARAEITPNPKKLCTNAAKDPKLIGWATKRSKKRFVPKFVRTKWMKQ